MDGGSGGEFCERLLNFGLDRSVRCELELEAPLDVVDWVSLEQFRLAFRETLNGMFQAAGRPRLKFATSGVL